MIFKKQYFLGFYFRDYQWLAMKKGIECCDSNVLNFILFSKSLNFFVSFFMVFRAFRRVAAASGNGKKVQSWGNCSFCCWIWQDWWGKKRIYLLYIVHCTCSLSSSSFFPFVLNKSVCFSVSLGNHQEGTFPRTIEWPYPRELW